MTRTFAKVAELSRPSGAGEPAAVGVERHLGLEEAHDRLEEVRRVEDDAERTREQDEDVDVGGEVGQFRLIYLNGKI